MHKLLARLKNKIRRDVVVLQRRASSWARVGT